MPAMHIAYDVPAGSGQLLQFDTGGTAPIHRLRFILGGKQQTFLVTRIVGLTDFSPDINFGGAGATPHEVTVNFAQFPLESAASVSFYIYLDNTTLSVEPLKVTAVWD